ncbi:MAG: DUF4351 domain-containing protein [Epulopiscium sp.]|nr:DUF4351 domain-containing protein [Candidatus Epulonipiscium sp.]
MTKRFGKLPDEMRNKISQLDVENLEIRNYYR